MWDTFVWSHALGLLAVCFTFAAAGTARSAELEPIPNRTVVLTFDDAVRSHLEFVAPLLNEYGFRATFFVSDRWIGEEHFLTWEEVGELHKMGFEVGNHTWTHSNFGSPKMAARLHGELALVENEFEKVGVPKPVSFAWPGNGFGTEALHVLEQCGYRFARRGMQPEVPYGEAKPGPVYDPAKHHPLLIPSAGDAYPGWTLEAFRNAVDRAVDGKIAVVQFHGVPDVAHPWVHTPPERFREYVEYLKEGGFNVIALGDLARYVDPASPPNDSMAFVRYTGSDRPLELDVEVTATRANLADWIRNMMADHGYSLEEAAHTCQYPVDTLQGRIAELGIDTSASVAEEGILKVLPYPGGRHPRIGFLDGAINPLRGTKVSIFPPWKDGGYVVLDVPEAIWSNLGLTFLAHTHIPTIWDEQHVLQENIDWTRRHDGVLEFCRNLPNGIHFGSRVIPKAQYVEFELWIENGTEETLTDLRAQVCVMLAAAHGFAAQSNEHRLYGDRVAATPNDDRDRWILIACTPCDRAWGNEDVPCIHSDPAFPEAAPGVRVESRGRLWFYKGADVEREIAKAHGVFEGS